MDSLILVGLFGVAGAYILECLLLEQKISHEGPWKSRKRHVLFREDQHIQAVALFDWIRRLFGIYKVHGYQWEVKTERAEMFTCPTCLSFWVALPFSVLFYALHPDWKLIIPVHFAIAMIAKLVHKAAFDAD